jgi:hypothetical protein
MDNDNRAGLLGSLFGILKKPAKNELKDLEPPEILEKIKELRRQIDECHVALAEKYALIPDEKRQLLKRLLYCLQIMRRRKGWVVGGYKYSKKDEVRERIKKYQREYYHRKLKQKLQEPEAKARLLAYRRNYLRRPGVIERRNAYFKAYYSRPEIKEKIKARRKASCLTPEVKAKIKAQKTAYLARPEVKARMKDLMKKYAKKYYSNPEVKERLRRASREYYYRKKAERAEQSNRPPQQPQ